MMMEHCDARHKSLLEVKTAAGGSGSLTPEGRVEFGQRALRLMAVSLARRVAADIRYLSADGLQTKAGTLASSTTYLYVSC